MSHNDYKSGLQPRFLVAFLITLLLPTAVFAQAGRSSILGTVTDQSGAAVPGASVTVVNIGTQAKRTVSTNERGDYEATALDVGTFEVSAEIAGFRREIVTGIRLEIDQRARVDLKLQVGELTQQISVEGSAPLIQTDDATLSTRIDEAKIRELPLPGNRNLYRLALLAPGMSGGSASSVTTGSLGVGFGIAAMGQKVHNNMVILDGAPMRQNTWAILRMRPSVEAIEEFRVESGWYSAEYGTQSGAQIISTIRPGTNNFHGVLFEFLRNDKLDARNFFENPTTPKRPLRRNTFGGVLSGPINHNKTFFTVNTEIFRERRSAQGFANYPTERMKKGDLTEPFFRPASGELVPILDLTSGKPFPNNQIPESRIFPQAKAFYQFWPSPNFGSSEFDGRNDYVGTSRSPINDNQVFVRIDHTLGNKDKLFGRLGIQNVDETGFVLNPHPYFVQRTPKHTRNATINWKRFLKPTLLNEFKVSYNRDVYKTVDDVLGSNLNVGKDLGIPGQTNDASKTAVPSISITGLSGLGNRQPLFVWDETRQVADSISLTRGNHSFKIGSDWTHVRVDFLNFNYLTGSFSFTGIHSGLGLSSAERGRLAWADFLVDQPNQVILGNYQQATGFDPGSFARIRQWRWHSYITDDWKITPRLTLNLGLRYEYDSVWQDIRGGSPNLDFSTGTLFPKPGVKGDLHLPNYRNVAPRIGLAWRPFGGTDTVIRAGAGRFFNRNMANGIAPQLALNPPFSMNINELNPAGNPRIGMHNADQASNIVGRGETLGIPKNFKPGQVYQWNLNIQRALPGNMVFEIGYVGSKSSNFDRTTELNMYISGTLIRPKPDLGPVEFLTTDASGTYEGLLTKLEKRFSRGLTFMQTYTWSHTLFDSLACCGAQRPSNPFNMRAEKGNAEADQRHRSTTSWLYELPWYKARHGLAGRILGGWQANGILTMEAGLPMHPTQGIVPIDDGCSRCSSRRPDRLGDGNLPGDQRTLDRWFDTGAFALAVGHYGSAGRNFLRAPGLVDLDFSLFKNFPIKETKNIQFRWEMYNATNTPPFSPPTLDISSANFGRITSAGLGREMQFGLRFEF